MKTQTESIKTLPSRFTAEQFLDLEEKAALVPQFVALLSSIADQAQNTADHQFFSDPHGLRNELRLLAEKARRASLGIMPAAPARPWYSPRTEGGAL